MPDPRLSAAPCGRLRDSAGRCAVPAKMRQFWWLMKQAVPKQIERYSRFSPSPLSIKQFLDFGECEAGGSSQSPRRPGLHGPVAATFRARRRCRGSPQPQGKVVGTAGGATGCPGGEGVLSGLLFRGAHRPGAYPETRNPQPGRDSPNLHD